MKIPVNPWIQGTRCFLLRQPKFGNVTRRYLSTNQLQDVVILSGVRTPISSFGGALKRLSATDLGAVAIKEAVQRSGVPRDAIDDCYMGFVLAAGAQNAPARQAILKAGLPDSVEATTLNKACASGMKAVMVGAQTIMTGQNALVVAGGMESLSNVPFLLPRRTLEWKEQKLLDGLYHDGYVDPGLGILMGDCCENNNRKMGITREAQDAYCVESYRRSTAAWTEGRLGNEVVPVTVKKHSASYVVTEDEEFRKFKPEKVSSLKPAFQKDGTITAANASKMNDGACALVLSSRAEADRRELKPLAKIVAIADAATAPIDFAVAPALAVDRLLKAAGVGKEQITMWEINEAFSGVILANIELLDLDPLKVNVNGGAVSIGHPVGSSGARIVSHLAHQLQPGELGVGSICNAGGAASAVLIQGL